jgi:hypothetical protein
MKEQDVKELFPVAQAARPEKALKGTNAAESRLTIFICKASYDLQQALWVAAGAWEQRDSSTDETALRSSHPSSLHVPPLRLVAQNGDQGEEREEGESTRRAG